MERVKNLDEFFDIYSRFNKTGEKKLTTHTVFEEKKLGEFLKEIKTGQIKTNDRERRTLFELGLLTEEHILKLEGKIPRKVTRKPGTAAKEIIIILKEMSRIVDIINLANGVKISDLLTVKQIEKIQRKTGLEFAHDTDIKRAINYLKFGGIPTNDKQRQELKELGIMTDKHIKKLEGKISKKKKEKKTRVFNEKDDLAKRKISPRNSIPEKMMKILLALNEMGIDVSEIRQSDSLRDNIRKRGLESIKQITGINDIDLDFRIGMYISNIRQGHIKTDKTQREALKGIGALNDEHILKLEDRDKLSGELKKVLSEIEAINIEEEEIKNELAKIKTREKELKEKLKGVEAKRDNVQKNLQELNSKGIQSKSR